MLIDLDLENLLLVQYNILKSNVTGRYDYEMRFMKGLAFRSGEDSQMGSGTIYATPKYNNNTQYASLSDIPRYDYVFIKSRNNELTLAKILIMFFLKPVQVTYKSKRDDDDPEDDNSEVDNEEAHICLIVQYLIKSERDNQRNISIGECYIWASSGIDRNSFSYDLITVQSIARPAFVIPGVGNAKSTTCKHDDIFYVLDRSYFDRSGWEVRHTLNDEDFVYTLQRQNDYIVANQTTLGNKENTGLNVYHQVMINNNLDDDADSYEDMNSEDENSDDKV